MDPGAASVRRDLRQAGMANAAIDAVWPEWWSEEAEQSLSAVTELRYTVARRLGLIPSSLLAGNPRFVWHDEAKFKGFVGPDKNTRPALTSFGFAVARPLLNATTPGPSIDDDVYRLRSQLLESVEYIDLSALLSLCWGIGIPVVALDVFPLERKRMAAMTVRVEDRFAILLGMNVRYGARVSYNIAHELGHINLGHFNESPAIIDLDDLDFEDSPPEEDPEERAAEDYALTLLTGRARPTFEGVSNQFTGAQLAQAARRAATPYRIDPGVIALCVGFSSRRWKQTYTALKSIPPGRQDIKAFVNEVARRQLNFDALTAGSSYFLGKVLGGPHA